MEHSKGERQAKDLILLVDDMSENLQVLGNLLKENNYRISFADSGEQALKMVRRTLPDLILLDVVMPGMNGFEVCKRLKSCPGTADIPIIFLTGKTETEDILKGFKLGGVDYVTKPFNGPELLLRVKTHLELKHAREELGKKNNELNEKNKQIMDSIRYAEKIQDAILPLDQRIDSLIGEHFIIFKPKDIVSGDFYWCGQVEEKILIAAVDCTGHGIPGAFMAMIGNTLLNKIVLEQKILLPSKILERLNIEVRRVLKQEQEKSKILDGMDVCLCLVEKEENKVTFSGSMRPLYIVKGPAANGTGRDGAGTEFVKIKGDFSPIGGKQPRRISKFTDKVVAVSSGDVIYLTSDGYVDQNNKENKKFGSNRFKDIIKNCAHLDPGKQKTILLEKLSEHQGREKQRDDILIIGIRI